MNYFNRIADKHTYDALKQVVDALNQIQEQKATTQQVAAVAASVPSLPQVQQQLQAGGTVPLNLTGLPGAAGSTSIGTHAQRLATPPKVGSFFVETDRTVLYVGETASSVTAWVYVAGLMYDSFANRPTDLGTNDTGFLYVPSEHLHQCRWGGAAWVILDNDAGTFIDSAVALGAGYQLCDGSGTTYLTISGAGLAETAFTTPNESGGGAGVYHTSIGAYTGTINAASSGTISGSTAAATATNQAASTGITVTTHNVTQITDVAGANNFAFTAGADAAHTVNDPTHNHTQDPHSHGVGTLVVSSTGQPRNLGVLRYFRR